MNPPTATPRTDDEETPLITNHRVSAETYKRMVDLARELKTELACEKENRNHLIEKGAKLETELAAAKGECERLTFAGEGHLIKTIQQQAELAHLRAELAVAENWVEHHSKHADDLIAENVKLRALFPAICSALGNGAFCTPDVSIGFLEAVPNEVASVVARLRAELKELSQVYELNKVSIDELDADRARAERAEADTARLDWLAVSDVWFDFPATGAFTPDTMRAAIDAAMKP